MELPEAKYTELNCYYTWMGEDGIARTKVKPGAEIEINDAVENSKVVNSLDPSKLYPLIVDTRKILSITKEARDHYAIKNRSTRIKAIAIIRDKTVGNMVANFFIGLNKPTVPVKLFKNEGEAIKWCEKFKEVKDEES